MSSTGRNLKLLSLLLLVGMATGCAAQTQIKPNRDIAWPPTLCSAAGSIYSPGSNLCANHFWFTGTSSPGTVTGANYSDFYLQTTYTRELWKCIGGENCGSWSAVSTLSEDWHFGSVDPVSTYVDGDFYFNLASGEIFQQQSGAWVSQGSTANYVHCGNTVRSQSVSNTASATVFNNLSCKIPANWLTAGSTISVDLSGLYTQTSTGIFTVTVSMCTVSGCGSGTNQAIFSAADALATVGVASPYDLHGFMSVLTVGAAATPNALGYMFYQGGAGMGAYGSPTFDSTVDEYVQISVQWNEANSSDTIKLDAAKIMIQR